MGTSPGAAGHGRLGAAVVLALVPLALLAIIWTSVLAANEAISIKDFAFHPKSLTIDLDDLVTWTNDDAVDHTIRSGGFFDVGPIPPGGSHTVAFGRAGTFEYGCTIHTRMQATIVVIGDAPASPEPTAGAVAAATLAAATDGPEVTAAPTDTIGPGDGTANANLVGELVTISAAAAVGFGLAFRRVSKAR